MAEDWSINVRQYAPDAEEGIIAGIVRHCGIALQSRDASLVAFSDKEETGRVRESFLKKKLALTDSDADLDTAIAAVGERLKGERNKNRVTVYYLLAEHYDLLSLFDKGGASKTAAKSTDEAPTEGKGVGAAALGVAGLAGAGLAAAGAKAADLGAAGVDAVKTGASDLGSATADAAKAGAAGLAAAGEKIADVGAAGVDAVKTGAADLGNATADTAKAGVDGLTAAGAAAVGLGAAGLAAGTAAVSGAFGKAEAAIGATPPVAPAATAQSFGGGARFDEVEEKSGIGRWLPWVLLALAALALFFYLTLGRKTVEAPVASPDAGISATGPDANASIVAPPAAAPAAIPVGAGVTTETRDGKPVVVVYFDTGKAVVVPAFGPAAVSLKTYLDANPGSKLAVSGFNDKTGNAAANAVLSKNRAKAVEAALTAASIPADAIELVKPSDSTDTGTTNAEARRVEVVIK